MTYASSVQTAVKAKAVARYAASLSDHLPMLKGGENMINKRFLFLVDLLLVRLFWANSKIDVCPYGATPFIRRFHICSSS